MYAPCVNSILDNNPQHRTRFGDRNLRAYKSGSYLFIRQDGGRTIGHNLLDRIDDDDLPSDRAAAI